MLVRSRAPVRIDLAGGWTDVSPFADREGGAVVNLAINRYTYVSLREHADLSIRIQSDDYASVVTADNIRNLQYDGRLDLIKAALHRLQIGHGVEIRTRADVPPGSGLGTSAAMGVAISGAIHALWRDTVSPTALADLARRLEVEELGIAGGKQDQLAAALGGINLLTFSADPPVATPLMLSTGVINELEQRLVLCYSGISRLSGDIIQRVQQAYLECKTETCDALRIMAGLAHTLAEALRDGRVDELGPLLRENWRCQQALHPTITNPDVERLFEVAMRNGVSGGKACGAGGGGCLVFIAHPEQEGQLRNSLADAGARIIDFNIDRWGHQTWRFDGATGRVL